jgi:hypothetical protein
MTLSEQTARNVRSGLDPELRAAPSRRKLPSTPVIAYSIARVRPESKKYLALHRAHAAPDLRSHASGDDDALDELHHL